MNTNIIVKDNVGEVGFIHHYSGEEFSFYRVETKSNFVVPTIMRVYKDETENYWEIIIRSDQLVYLCSIEFRSDKPIEIHLSQEAHQFIVIITSRDLHQKMTVVYPSKSTSF